jgi:hypothetical protein
LRTAMFKTWRTWAGKSLAGGMASIEPQRDDCTTYAPHPGQGLFAIALFHQLSIAFSLFTNWLSRVRLVPWRENYDFKLCLEISSGRVLGVHNMRSIKGHLGYTIHRCFWEI